MGPGSGKGISFETNKRIVIVVAALAVAVESVISRYRVYTKETGNSDETLYSSPPPLE